MAFDGDATGAMLSKMGHESSWASQLEADGMTNLTFHSFKSSNTNSTSGTMRAALQTVSDENGCKNWVFYYSMVHAGGSWKIANQSVAPPRSC